MGASRQSSGKDSTVSVQEIQVWYLLEVLRSNMPWSNSAYMPPLLSCMWQIRLNTAKINKSKKVKGERSL